MSHFLLIYDRTAGRLVSERRFASSADAIAARFDAEAEWADRPDIEIVAVGAESEEALRRTHGRYFLGLQELAGRLG